MKKHFFAVFLSILTACVASPAAAGSIGFINLERVLEESRPARESLETIKKEFAVRESNLHALEERGARLRSTLDTKGMTMSDGERAKAESELQQLGREFDSSRRELEEKLNARRQEALEELDRQVTEAVKALAESEHLDLVVREAVWFGARSDLTDRVIKMLESKSASAAGK